MENDCDYVCDYDYAHQHEIWVRGPPRVHCPAEPKLCYPVSFDKTPKEKGNPSMPNIEIDKLRVIPGRPYPVGTAVYEEGMRFTIFSRHATRVWLALFDSVDDHEPLWEHEFNPKRHKTGDMWSIFVYGIRPGAYYMYRMDGPNDAQAGHRYNPAVYLLDPYGKAFAGDVHRGTMKCVAVHEDMDWSDERPRIPMKDTVIYETHVRGFTKHGSSGVRCPGTYQGLVEKIPYLQDLGVTAVELLPVQEFGETYLGRCSLASGEELSNYWGYSSIGFFAPAGRYACSAVCLEHLEEFRTMVDALHLAGIEIILDVVFNHTSEGNERGRTLCFRGIDNRIYYLLEDGAYFNYSGCGNTVNCNHPLVRDFIMDCLRYWVAVMHIDGFRFDLASILGRDEDGSILSDAPLIERIAEDPVLRDCKLIAEAWDAGGAYQVGSFGGVRWAEWNGKYRDAVRHYWHGDAGFRAQFASRLSGSADVYEWAERNPEHSINFITCHDGYTLHDLVSYNEKHNEANGEENRDGHNDNISHNFGVEGETGDPEINATRLRMQKNYLATLFLSLGVPMLLGGDEFGRTQKGNNNAYCQDNVISWTDWSLLEKNPELFRFCKLAIAFRKENPALRRNAFYRGLHGSGHPETADLLWFDEHRSQIDWNHPALPLACRIHPKENNDTGLYMMFNSTDGAVHFRLPPGKWIVRIDTSADAPQDITEPGETRGPIFDSMDLAPKSLAVLTTLPLPNCH